MEPREDLHYGFDPEDGVFLTAEGRAAGFTLAQAREAHARKVRSQPAPHDPED